MTGDSEEKEDYSAACELRQTFVDAVLRSNARKKPVVAGPGTGKTYLFKGLLDGKKKCLTLTFVNTLVEDLSLELCGLSDVKTLHGFARGQLKRFTSKPVRIYPKLSSVIRQDASVLLEEDIDFDSIFHNRIDSDEWLIFYKERRQYYDHYGFSDVVYIEVMAKFASIF